MLVGGWKRIAHIVKGANAGIQLTSVERFKKSRRALMEVKVTKEPKLLEEVPDCGNNFSGPALAVARGMPNLELLPFGGEVSC